MKDSPSVDTWDQEFRVGALSAKGMKKGYWVKGMFYTLIMLVTGVYAFIKNGLDFVLNMSPFYCL